MFNGLIKKAFALVIILLSVCAPACSESPTKTEDKPQISVTKTNEPQPAITQIEQKAVSLRKYVRGGNRDIVIYDFGDYTEKEIMDALDVLQIPGGFLVIKDSAIIFKGEPLNLTAVSTWKSGLWKREFLYKLDYWKRELTEDKKDNIKDWRVLSTNQQYGGKMPMLEVGPIQLPKIKFEFLVDPETKMTDLDLKNAGQKILDILLVQKEHFQRAKQENLISQENIELIEKRFIAMNRFAKMLMKDMNLSHKDLESLDKLSKNTDGYRLSIQNTVNKVLSQIQLICNNAFSSI